MNSEKRIQRGHAAAHLMGDETLRLALTAVRERAMQSIREASDEPSAWRARGDLLAAEELVGVLHRFATDGRAAALEMSRAEAEATGAAEASLLEEQVARYRHKAKEAREAAAQAGIATPRGDTVHKGAA